jgi:hypothetical protein
MRFLSALKAPAWGAVAAILAFAGPPAYASPVVTIDNVSGTWSDVTGSPRQLSGVGTNQIFFGSAATDRGQSGYVFSGSAGGSYGAGDVFSLGTFTHINFPVFTSITGATLNLTVTGHASDGQVVPFSLTAAFVFTHNETPNRPTAADPKCCADIVTAVSNPGASQILHVNGADYEFAFSGFEVGGVPFSQFLTAEDQSNEAMLNGSFTQVRPVPGPTAGQGTAGSLIFILLAGALFLKSAMRKPLAQA